jgi:hypothetical protein
MSVSATLTLAPGCSPWRLRPVLGGTRLPSRTVAAGPTCSAQVAAVISSPDLGVFAVAAAGVCVLFPAWWTHYLNSVSAAGQVQISLSLLTKKIHTSCSAAADLCGDALG